MDIQPPKPNSASDAFTLFALVGVTLLGGLASFVQKMKQNHVRVWNLTELVGELTISAFAASIAYNLCQWTESLRDTNLTIAIVGVCAHMGAKAIKLMEGWLTSRYAPPMPPASSVPPAAPESQD